MAKTQVSVSYTDKFGKAGTFGFIMDAAFNAAPYTELYVALNALRAASQCQITQVLLSDVLDISPLTNLAPSGTTSDCRINEQAILAFRSTTGSDVKLSVPGPVDTLFVASGGYAGQDVDPTTPAFLTLKAAFEGGFLLDKSENACTYRKGWRKGHPHS